MTYLKHPGLGHIASMSQPGLGTQRSQTETRLKGCETENSNNMFRDIHF